MAQVEMKKTPNAQHLPEKVGIPAESTTSNIKPATGRVRPNVGHRTSSIPWRLIDLVVGGIFIYGGLLKMLDPVRFASDIDNYKILPWMIGVALAFYLPWLEIFCGAALILRLLYGGALLILTVLTLVFTLATVAAKVRGLDITCGCFGHASKSWSFTTHLALDLLLLAALTIIWNHERTRPRLASEKHA
jgi:putative oxidoreductase